MRATAHATEIVDRVGEAMQNLCDLDTFQECSQIIPLEGHHGNAIHFVETEFKRQREIRAILDRLITEPGRLLNELEQRVDDDGTLYLRFDKQRALAGEVVLARGEDDIQVRIRPEVHPSKRELAIAALQTWLEARAAAAVA